MLIGGVAAIGHGMTHSTKDMPKAIDAGRRINIDMNRAPYFLNKFPFPRA